VRFLLLSTKQNDEHGLELKQARMAQQPLLWVEVGVHAVRIKSKCGGWCGQTRVSGGASADDKAATEGRDPSFPSLEGHVFSVPRSLGGYTYSVPRCPSFPRGLYLQRPSSSSRFLCFLGVCFMLLDGHVRRSASAEIAVGSSR
jgi:hypothetical protein